MVWAMHNSFEALRATNPSELLISMVGLNTALTAAVLVKLLD